MCDPARPIRFGARAPFQFGWQDPTAGWKRHENCNKQMWWPAHSLHSISLSIIVVDCCCASDGWRVHRPFHRGSTEKATSFSRPVGFLDTTLAASWSMAFHYLLRYKRGGKWSWRPEKWKMVDKGATNLFLPLACLKSRCYGPWITYVSVPTRIH